MATIAYRLRKISDVSRRNAILFELLDGESIILSVGITDAGALDIVFEEGVSKRIFGPELLTWIAKAMSETLSENALHADR